MLQEIWAAVQVALGLEAETLTFGQMALRALVVFTVGLVAIRVGERRSLGKTTPFDVVLSVVLGAVLGSAITEASAFFPKVGVSILLVVLHWGLAVASFHSTRFSTLVKGEPRTLVEDGEIRWEGLRASSVSKEDLLGALRSTGKVDEVEKVELARLERTGEISVIPHDPKRIEVAVEKGVQTIRIELA